MSKIDLQFTKTKEKKGECIYYSIGFRLFVT